MNEPPRRSGSPAADDDHPDRPGGPGGPDDRTLLAAHIDGDPDAFGTLFGRHRDRLWAVALRTTGDPEEAADALQDAMIAAFRRAASYRGDAAVTTWLHRVVVNACLDRLRRRKVRLADPLPDDLDEHADRGALVTSTQGGPGTEDPADRAVADERRAAVMSALETLPTEQRAALALVDMEGYSVEETAAILECAPGTVKSRCSRGRSRLAPLLADLAPAEHPVRNRPGDGRVSSTSPDPGAGTPAAANAPPSRPAAASSDVPAEPDAPDRPNQSDQSDQSDEEVSSP